MSFRVSVCIKNLEINSLTRFTWSLAPEPELATSSVNNVSVLIKKIKILTKV
jgi:hypothetical protein